MSGYMFPGQGSQKIGMGEELFDRFSSYTKNASEILGYDIKKLCLEEEKKLNQTQYTQPALYTVNCMSFLDKNTPLPKVVLGHSLGEYSALFAAEVFDFKTGLELVKKRGELMSQAKGGSMAAIVGISSNEIKDILSQNNLDDIDIANLNEPLQTVLSGPEESILKAKPIFEPLVRIFVPLNVSGAFHSRYMKEAQHEFKEFLQTFDFSKPKLDIIANVTAQKYTKDTTIELLSNQITNSVRWVESIENVLNNYTDQLDEIGPGKVLTGLLRKIKKSVTTS